MKYDHDDLMLPALEIIKRADREVYDRMMGCDWQTYTLVNPYNPPFDDVLIDFGAKYGIFALFTFLSDVSRSLGITDHSNGPLHNVTFFNYENIINDAKASGVTPTKLLADVMVHEFHHANNPEAGKAKAIVVELPAYAAGAKFAEETGDPALISYAEGALNDAITGKKNVK